MCVCVCGCVCTDTTYGVLCEFWVSVMGTPALWGQRMVSHNTLNLLAPETG